jgi:hypothetical protein
MRTKHTLSVALAITLAVLLSGCGKGNPKLESENAALKARVQKLEQQLKATGGQMASPGAQPGAVEDLKRQLAEVQKQAEENANQLTLVNSLVETQKVNIDDLMQELSRCQQATEKANQALKLYQDKASSALKEFQALRGTLGSPTAKADEYHLNYLAMQKSVTGLVSGLPESKVRRAITGVLSTYTRVNDVWEAAGELMEARTREAQEEYDKFVDFGGLGPNDLVVKMGKDKILVPAEQANAAMVTVRDEKMDSFVKDIDQGIKNLQALMSGNGA